MKLDILNLKKAEQVLIDNGVAEDEASVVLQAIGYALLGKELYPESPKVLVKNIKWDVTEEDVEDGTSVKDVIDSLPSELEVDLKDLGIDLFNEELVGDEGAEELEEAISDYVTDTTDFCNDGFTCEVELEDGPTEKN